MRLFIAEKPSVARAISELLGVTSKGDGFIQCGNNTVTWCFGHMLEFASPDEYTPDDVPKTKKGKKIWRVDELPIIPGYWKLKPRADAKKQIKVIGDLLKKASDVVNAGDPDREGQLLVDELLEHFKNNKPVLRYWANAIDSVSVERALGSLKNNSDYHGLAHAAIGRSKADWLIGMNLSRAYTLRAQRGGSNALLTVGRVQTPTLNMVVTRDRTIANFTPVQYFTIKAKIEHPNGAFWANWKASDNQAGLDSEGRLLDQSIAIAIRDTLTNKNGSISHFSNEPKKTNHPLAFSLSGITALASKKFSYSAEDVLKTCQSLYETHKLTTYPRTDCAYLPESQLSDAPQILSALKTLNPELTDIIDRADPNYKSRTWNDKKVSAHHGIIPTMHIGDTSKLNDKEQNIYSLIVRAYIAQFHPLHEYMQAKVEIAVEGEILTASGKVITNNGWRDVYDDSIAEDAKEDNQSLPDMATADTIETTETQLKDAKTKPPAKFTEGTLITAMVNVHKYIDDEEQKKNLRDGDGIGTEATRASIISELKRRDYLQTQGKYIVSTDLGKGIIDALPEVVKSPVLTAMNETMLKNIEQGGTDLSDFIHQQEQFITAKVADANAGAAAVAGAAKREELKLSEHTCGDCDSPLIRRPGKTKGTFWWGCSGYPNCKKTYQDAAGKPNYEQKPKNTVSEYKCGKCESGLIRRPGKKPNTFWWGCSSFPNCKQTYQDDSGKPKF